MSDPIVRQGTLDGFCGVYAAAYVLTNARSTNTYDIQSNFHALLKSLEQLKHLSAASIAGRNPGFTDLALTKAINNISARKLGNLRAVAMRTAAYRSWRLYGKAKEAIAEGAKFIIKQNGDSHWVAVIGLNDDNTYACYDPETGAPAQRSRIAHDQGVVIGLASLFDVQ